MRTDALSPVRSWWAAVLATAATYFYFLLFAEFAFLKLAETHARSAGSLRLVMAALGLGGVAGAVGAALAFGEGRARAQLTWAFRACALSGAIALAASNAVGIAVAALVCGTSLGALTVTLAAMLRGAIGHARLGLGIGAGTGVAYALCNVPWVFHASPVRQTLLAVAAMILASFLPRTFSAGEAVAPDVSRRSRGDLAAWTVILLALVWLDSAAFYIVQHEPTLRAATWDASGTLWRNAGVHLVAALVAGMWVDRGYRPLVAGIAAAALAAAGLVLNGTWLAGWSANGLYTAGVSLYSVVLVEVAARTGRPSTAAVVFAVAGWVGSALGIGMAQDLARIPLEFIAAASAAVGLALVWRWRVARAAGVLLAGIGMMRGDDVARGREVYIAEGCIHCHSQYLRPRVATEVLNWGPATPLPEALAATPPLFGTRRQGPDLSQVGNRRSAEWNRLHLIAPQSISPGSRMPGYAYLFAGDGKPGDALLAYLAALGAQSRVQRQQQIAAWRPRTADAIAPAAAARLFARLCVPCHGPDGRGDGALAGRLSVRPPDWSTMPWRRVPPGEKSEIVLSRIIKFGLPGLPMAGHEYLPDAEIVGLARHVETLNKAGGSHLSAAAQP